MVAEKVLVIFLGSKIDAKNSVVWWAFKVCFGTNIKCVKTV